VLRELINSYGFEFEVVESVKVHEDIKLGLPSRDGYISAFNQTLRNLASEGIKVVCYDFMPVFDWMRTDTAFKLPDGSKTLVYYEKDLPDPLKDNFSLPDWESVYTPEQLNELFAAYKDVNEEKLWENLAYFINAVIPVAEECGIRMGMHPDDPCWPIFGLPRIITDEARIDRFLSLYDSPYNALTLCSGSLGCSADNDVARLVRKYAGKDRIAFGHMRNVKLLPESRDFEESAHYSSCGSLDMADILKAYHENSYKGYIRPDHGRMIWDEEGAAGYGLYDRALGAMYLLGIWETLDKYTKKGLV
jgi:mannonate dehydratase